MVVTLAELPVMTMTIEISFFGYGVGLVVVGYCCGIILGVALDALNSMRG